MLNWRFLLALIAGCGAGCSGPEDCTSGIKAGFRVINAETGQPVCPYDVRVIDEDGQLVESFREEAINGQCGEFYIPPKVTFREPGTYVFEIRADGFKPSATPVDLDRLDCDQLRLAALEGQRPNDRTVTLEVTPS